MFLENGIKISSKNSMHHFMMAVLADNDNSQRDKGFTDTDIIEIFEQTEEVMTLNETQKKNHAKTFADIVPKLAKKVNKLNRKYRPSETQVLELLPMLTSVVLEIFTEETFQRKTKLTFENKEIEFKP